MIDLFLQAAGFLGARFFNRDDLLLELGQAVGDGLELRLEASLRQLLSIMERLIGALHHLLGDGGGGLRLQEGAVFGALLFHDPHPRRGVLEIPSPCLSTVGAAALHQGPGDRRRRRHERGDEGDKEEV